MEKTFNILIFGVGGQGLMTLLHILSQASFASGLDVKTSELHGLAQRGGSVAVHIRFGEKVASPMVSQGQADLVIALEQQEVLTGVYFANPETVFLVNQFQTPTMQENLEMAEIKKEMEKVSQKVYWVPASEICQKELQNEVVSGIYLLGYALKNGFLSLPKESIISAIKKAVPEKFQELNIKAIELAYSLSS